MSCWTLGSMVSQWVISPTYKWFVYWGYNPLILTFDPNFLAGTSRWVFFPKLRIFWRQPLDPRTWIQCLGRNNPHLEAINLGHGWKGSHNPQPDPYLGRVQNDHYMAYLTTEPLCPGSPSSVRTHTPRRKFVHTFSFRSCSAASRRAAWMVWSFDLLNSSIVIVIVSFG